MNIVRNWVNDSRTTSEESKNCRFLQITRLHHCIEFWKSGEQSREKNPLITAELHCYWKLMYVFGTARLATMTHHTRVISLRQRWASVRRLLILMEFFITNSRPHPLEWELLCSLPDRNSNFSIRAANHDINLIRLCYIRKLCVCVAIASTEESKTKNSASRN